MGADPHMDLELNGRVALVTGSYRGTGKGVATVLAREGATVIVHGFEQGAADAVAVELRKGGGEAIAVAGDIRTDAGAMEVADRVLAATRHVDILVNNYGVAEGGSWDDSTPADWIDAYQKNVLSGVRLVRSFVPGMKARAWGRVIFVGTVGSARPGPRMPHYYASKAVLANMTLSLAKDLSNTGITVNTVSPGLIATDEVRATMTRRAERQGLSTEWADVEKMAAREFMPNTTGRVGTTEDIGELIAFLASDRARYINAANYRIDGGSADCVNP